MKFNSALSKHSDEILSLLKDARNKDIRIGDVMSMAEIMMNSMHAFFESMDMAVYKEMRDIASYIEKAKGDISNLQANKLKGEHIPVAGRELDEVVAATEAATDKIMENAEKIMEADISDPAAYQTVVNSCVMEIFEACSFQDITGQRITKVVTTLKHIEDRVSRFADATGVRDGDDYVSEEEEARLKREKEQILHGPQSNDDATNQNDIDAMFD
ncbi:MAG: protein phosphatase CheZ [Rhizobiales bacterium]|nr:protein phosphatase CheZ [Hyphomicrobiales bacterium]